MNLTWRMEEIDPPILSVPWMKGPRRDEAEYISGTRWIAVHSDHGTVIRVAKLCIGGWAVRLRAGGNRDKTEHTVLADELTLDEVKAASFALLRLNC